MVFDSETETMMSIASHLTLANIHTWPVVRHIIRTRCEMFRSGRTQAPRWFRRRLQQIDPNLDVRWDYLEGQWIIERYSRLDRAYVTVMEVKGHLDQEIIFQLEEADTWRFPNWKAYLEWKHAESARRRARIAAHSQERVAAAIDGLTEKQAKEFLDVERAFRTGETVVFHGGDQKTLDHMREGARRAEEQGFTPPSGPALRPSRKPKGD